MADNARRNFLKKAAAGLAIAATYPTARVLGANDRIRVGMIGPGARGHGYPGPVRGPLSRRPPALCVQAH